MRDLERRLGLLESKAPPPETNREPTAIEAWAASLSHDALKRVVMLCRCCGGSEPDRGDEPLSAFERSLLEVACVDGPDGWGRHDPADPQMRELRYQLQRWLDGERVFMAGADVRGWLRWHRIIIDELRAGELVRLVELVKVLEAHPVEGAALTFEAFWTVLGRDPLTDVRLQRSAV